MNRGATVNLLLLIVILPLGELHQLWSKSRREIDVFLLKDYKTDIQWVVKDISDGLAHIILAILVYRLVPAGLKSAAAVFVAYRVYEMVLYFINFKTYGYLVLYLAMFLIILLSFVKPTRNSWKT